MRLKISDKIQVEKNKKSMEFKNRYMVWFFAGGETRDNRFNIFTGSFIRSFVPECPSRKRTYSQAEIKIC
jgi:hypothetical protein